jgi:hypothetical protein
MTLRFQYGMREDQERLLLPKPRLMLLRQQRGVNIVGIRADFLSLLPGGIRRGRDQEQNQGNPY